MNLLDELQEHVVCGDGAMGTLLLIGGSVGPPGISVTRTNANCMT